MLSSFNPNECGKNTNIFALPYTYEQANVVVLPVPWEMTVSYKQGTSLAPAAIIKSSSQIDYMLYGVKEPWTLGITLQEEKELLGEPYKKHRKEVSLYLQYLADPSSVTIPNINIEAINTLCAAYHQQVFRATEKIVQNGKIPALIGGEHSISLGGITALANKYPGLGILQIDAHMDLRKAYEDLTYSHASVMYNVLTTTVGTTLWQVGIRDYCPEEVEIAKKYGKRVQVFYDAMLKEALFAGEHWKNIVKKIINFLPDYVYISVDIDGLDIPYALHTGTPVPGGLSYDQCVYLVKEIALSGRKIVGIDVCEVSVPCDAFGEHESTDSIVAMRLLYQLCVYAGVSQGLLQWENQ